MLDLGDLKCLVAGGGSDEAGGGADGAEGEIEFFHPSARNYE